MAKKAKSTKKFEKNQLKSTLERRKDFAKVKQRHKQKEKRNKDAANAQESNSDDEPKTLPTEVENMDRDDFFQESMPLPTMTKSTSKKRKRENGAEKAHEPASDSVSSVGSEEDDEDHRGQLEALAANDPEFYKYLQENDAELLDFDEDEDEEEENGDATRDGENEKPSKKQKTTNEPEITVITVAMVNKWKDAMVEQQSVRSLKQLIFAFKAAAHGEDEEKQGQRYSIPSSDVYHEIMVTALQHVPNVLKHHLPVKETASGKVRIPTNSPKFKSLSPLIKSHASSLHSLLGSLSDPGTLRLTLQSFEPLLPFLLQFRKFLKTIIKSIATVWADNSSDEATRISAFIILRRLMVIGDAGLRETVLKSTYEGIVKSARNVTELTLPGVNLMKNSASELWGIDQKVSYTTAFTFIRQLAIHLRGHITKPTKESYKQIYNWQFVHSLDFWSRVLSSHCNSVLEAQQGKESQLRPLIYPVVQVTLGVMRLIPTSIYFPLRFQLMRSLLRISQATGTYIPLSAALLEVLNSPEMKKSAKAATLRPLDFATNIRAPASYLKTRVYQDGVGDQVLELFSEFFVLWTKSIAYPELQLPVTVMLKRWLKTVSKREGNKNGKLNQSLLLLVQKSEANAKWIEERRQKVNFAPKDRTEVEAFLKDTSWEETPLGAFVVTQRKQREDKKKVIDQGRREETKKRKALEKEQSEFEVD